MIKPESLLPGVLFAGIAAGPLFVLTTAAASLYLLLPAPVEVTSAGLAFFVMMLLFAMIFGTIVAIPVNAVCATAMAAAGRYIAFARLPVVWSGAGALLAAAAVFPLDIPSHQPASAFGLIATSAACGWICGRCTQWTGAD